MPAAPAHGPSSASMTPLHIPPITPRSDQADFEPDEAWKHQLRERIKESVHGMEEEARQSQLEELRKKVVSLEGRDRLEAEYKKRMKEIKRLVEDQYEQELNKERQQRRWIAGVPVDSAWIEILEREQAGIMNSIKQSQGGDSPTEERRPKLRALSIDRPNSAAKGSSPAPPVTPQQGPQQYGPQRRASLTTRGRDDHSRRTHPPVHSRPSLPDNWGPAATPDTAEETEEDILRRPPPPPPPPQPRSRPSIDKIPVTSSNNTNWMDGTSSLGRSSGSIRSVLSDRIMAHSPPKPELWMPTISPAEDAALSPSPAPKSSHSPTHSQTQPHPPYSQSQIQSHSVPHLSQSHPATHLGRRGSTASIRSTGSGSGNSIPPTITETILEGSDGSGDDDDDDDDDSEEEKDEGEEMEKEKAKVRSKEREREWKSKVRDKPRERRIPHETTREKQKDKEKEKRTFSRRNGRPAPVELRDLNDDPMPSPSPLSNLSTPLKSATMQYATSPAPPRLPRKPSFAPEERERERYIPPRDGPQGLRDSHPPFSAREPPPLTRPVPPRSPYGPDRDREREREREEYGPQGPPRPGPMLPFPADRDREREREYRGLGQKPSFGYDDRRRERGWDNRDLGIGRERDREREFGREREWDSHRDRDRERDLDWEDWESHDRDRDRDPYTHPHPDRHPQPSHYGSYSALSSSRPYPTPPPIPPSSARTGLGGIGDYPVDPYDDRLDRDVGRGYGHRGPPGPPDKWDYRDSRPMVSRQSSYTRLRDEGEREREWEREREREREMERERRINGDFPDAYRPTYPSIPIPPRHTSNASTLEDIAQPAWRDWVGESNGRRPSETRYDYGHARSPPISAGVATPSRSFHSADDRERAPFGFGARKEEGDGPGPSDSEEEGDADGEGEGDGKSSEAESDDRVDEDEEVDLSDLDVETEAEAIAAAQAEADATASAAAAERERLAREKEEKDEREAAEREARHLEEEARRHELEAETRRKEEEALRLAAEAHKKEEEASKKMEEAEKKEAEVRKKEAEARRKEKEAKRMEAEAGKKAEEAKKKEDEVNRKEVETKKREAKVKEAAERNRKAQAEANQRLKALEEETRKREKEMKEREAALKRREEDLLKREADNVRREGEAMQKEVEARRKEEEAARKGEEAQRKGEEAQRKEEEVQRKEEEALRKEEEAKRMAFELEEEAKRKREEVRRKEAEAKKEQERLEQENQRKEQEQWQWRQQEKAKREQERYEDERRRRQKDEERTLEDPFYNVDHDEQAYLMQQAEMAKRADEIARMRDRRRHDSVGNDSAWTAPSYATPSPGTSPGMSRPPPPPAPGSGGDRSSNTSNWGNSGPAWSTSTKPSSTASPTANAPPRPPPTSIPSAKPRTGSVGSGTYPSGASPHTTTAPVNEAEWARRQEKLANEQQERFRREQEKLEAERVMKTAGRQLTKDELLRVFEQHERLWSRLHSQSKLAWTDFPWPIIRTPNDPEEISLPLISAYIQSPCYPEKDKSRSTKDRIKDQIKRWHPDRFETKLLAKVVEEEREKVKQGAGNVARYLGDLLRKENENSNGTGTHPFGD